MRLSLRRVEDEAYISFELCLGKWQGLIELLKRCGASCQEAVLRLRFETCDALGKALEKQSKLEHERAT